MSEIVFVINYQSLLSTVIFANWFHRNIVFVCSYGIHFVYDFMIFACDLFF